MENRKDHIEQLFAEKLGKLDMQPPQMVWHRIDARRKNRRIMLLFRYAAVVVLLLASAFTIRYFLTQPENQTLTKQLVLTQAGNNSLQNAVDVAEAVTASTAVSGSVETLVSASRAATRTASNDTGKSETRQLNATESEQQLADATLLLSSAMPEDKTSEIVSAGTTDHLADSTDSEDLSTLLLALIPAPEIADDVPTLAVQNVNITLAFGQTPGFNSGTNGSDGIAGANFSFDKFAGDLAYETRYFEEVERTDFSMPLSFGLLFSYPVSQSLLIESGLQYTRLAHENSTFVINDYQNRYKTNLHYLGLPLGIRFVMLKDKRIRLFITQAFVLEKGLGSHSVTERYFKGKLYETSRDNTHIRGMQLSSVSSGGAETSLVGKLSAYVQAGVQVFFMNETQPFNMRSEHSAWPSFQAGLRFDLSAENKRGAIKNTH